MSDYIIECPSCGKYIKASNGIFNTGLFGTKKTTCSCGYEIDTKTEKIVSTTCSKCGNTVIYDRTKNKPSICPVCKNLINGSSAHMVTFSCPACSCELSAAQNATQYICPLCNKTIDVQAEIKKQEIRKNRTIDVLKYEGDNQTLIWKHPIEDFNTGSQLIVHESQEAIFFRDGQALDLFGAGRYTLETQNLPLLKRFFNFTSDTQQFFHSEVYFINRTTQMGIKWGTDSKVRLFNPATGMTIELGACGHFSLVVSDSRRLLIKLVGTENGLSQSNIIGEDTKTAVSGFKPMILTKVKSNLARIIKENNINVLELDLYLDTISDQLRVCVNEGLEEYGLSCPEFFVTRILTPDDDPNFIRLKQQYADIYLKVRDEQIRKAEAEAAGERRAAEAAADARVKIIGAQGDTEITRLKAAAESDAYRMKAVAEAEEMHMKGYTYGQETARQVSVGAVESMASSGGSAGTSALGGIAELGISLGAMGSVLNMTKEAMSPVASSAQNIGNNIAANINGDLWNCSCGNTGVSGNFCNICGSKRPEPIPDKWDCSCGNKGIIGNFCNICGSRRPAQSSDAWDCSCGNKRIIGNFCNICGKRKGE